MNTARLTATVAWFGNYWQVNIGGVLHVAKTGRDLSALLSGKPPETKPIEEPPPPPHRESVAEYLARGGTITKVSFPKPTPLPPAVPEPFRPAASRITLESLGLLPKKKA